MMKKTSHFSWCSGPLSEGCKQCVKGKKLVLFITGLCAQRCFYCPVSEQKYGKDVVFANEWQIVDPKNPTELVKEAEMMGAKGAGITGGDPLVKVDRCAEYIRLLKKRFGERFHVHLYTPLKLVTEERLQRLFDAGLDEIRFHPDLDDESLWPRLLIARRFSWSVGVEIPAIPGYDDKTKRLIDFIGDKVDFLNLNELELSDTRTSHYNLAAFAQKDSVSYGAKGAIEMAKCMVAYADLRGLRAHLCTAKLKDAVQLKNRMKARSKNQALHFDIQTDEGLLMRGCVFLPDLVPGIDYRARLKSADKAEVLGRLGAARESMTKLGVLAQDVVVDEQKLRLLAPPNLVVKLKKGLLALDLVPAIVEEFPTIDSVEVEIDFLT